MFDRQSIDDLRLLLGSCWRDRGRLRLHQRDVAISHLASHPQFFFSHGYDEARVFIKKNEASNAALNSYYKEYSQALNYHYEPFKGSITTEVLLHHCDSGQWRSLCYIWGGEAEDPASNLDVGIIDSHGNHHPIPVELFINALTNPSPLVTPSEYRVIFGPATVSPSIRRQNILISQVADTAIASLKEGKIILADVAARDLEELVAELLARQGMKVKVTPRTRDGGRDVIAIGEFFPGFQSTLAVEVTRSAKVGIGKLAKAAYQIATSRCL